MKILMLIDAWYPHVGGGQIHVWELSKKIADQGNNVVIYTRNLGNWDDNYPGVEVKRVGSFIKFANPFGRLEYLILALFYSIKTDYDVLHAHAFSPGLIVPFVKLFRNKPTVFTVHGKGDKIAGLNVMGGLLEDLVVYKIPYDLEISVAKKTVVKKFAAKKLEIIPNGIDINKFKMAVRKREKITNLLYVGRLSYEKGVDLLVEAFKKINLPKLTLTIVGEGVEKGKLLELAKGSRVNFKGKLEGDMLIKEFYKADLLILPSRTEGHPLTLFEAWASKLPILATNVGDNAVYIKDKQNGFLTESKVDVLSGKIEEMLEVKNLEDISCRAYKEVLNYSWTKIADATLKGYKGVLNGS